ncbi:hypothetical protein WMY93_012525 [Mugilogobius chulae]|uniref:Uncharacterized protein n=1 Tax=Mugilogobius chulae TaxID=88201 RepID=A0AAW0PEG1_9GOBI
MQTLSIDSATKTSLITPSTLTPADSECSLTEDHRADVLLLLDGFTNITSEDFSKVTEFLDSLVQILGVVGLDSVQFALVKSDKKPEIEFDFNTYHDVSSVVGAVKNLSQSPASPGDLTSEGVEFVRKTVFHTDEGGRDNAPDALILISDRNSSGVNKDTVRLLWHSNVKVFIVGIKEADYSDLNHTGDDLDGSEVFFAQDLKALPSVLNEFIQSFCYWIKSKHDLAPPESVRFSDVESRRARVSWTYNGRSVKWFYVVIKPDSRWVDVLPHKRTTELLHLKPNTSYEIQISTYESAIGPPVIGHFTTQQGKVVLSFLRHCQLLFSLPTHLHLLHSLPTPPLPPHTSSCSSLSPTHPLAPSLVLCLCLADSVRLSGGPGRCSGSLEVLVDQMWSSVCAEDFGQTEAEVVCRELDCGGVSELQRALFTEGSAVGRSFHCNGAETALKDCESSETRCSAAANITCTDDVMLWLGGLRCSGYLMLIHEDKWRLVKPLNQHQDLDLDFGSALCQQLGCGLAVHVGYETTNNPFWMLDPECVNEKAGLRHCVHDSNNTEDMDRLFLTCSELYPDLTITVSSEEETQILGHKTLVRSGANFTVSCSLDEPFMPAQLLLFSPTGNYTLPAVNHSAHFHFLAIGPAHAGHYTCGYKNKRQNKTIKDVTLHIGPGVPDSDLILRAVIHHVLILLITTTALCFYCQAKRKQRE